MRYWRRRREWNPKPYPRWLGIRSNGKYVGSENPLLGVADKNHKLVRCYRSLVELPRLLSCALGQVVDVVEGGIGIDHPPRQFINNDRFIVSKIIVCPHNVRPDFAEGIKLRVFRCYAF